MKKLLALLLSCAMITVACASCDKDEKKEKESKAESSAVSDDKDDKEDDDKDDKKDEESKKDKEDKEDSKKDESSKGSASVEDSSICGSWTSEDLFGAVLVFGEDGSLETTFDYSEMMSFKDGQLSVMGQTCDTTFDGSKLEASMQGQVVLSLERKGAKDESTMDGEYVPAESMGEDSLSVFGDGEIAFIIEGDKLIVSAEMGTYTADGKTLVMKGGSTILSSDTAEDGEDVEESCEYKIEGDTLTLIMADDEGESVELTRVK